MRKKDTLYVKYEEVKKEFNQLKIKSSKESKESQEEIKVLRERIDILKSEKISLNNELLLAKRYAEEQQKKAYELLDRAQMDFLDLSKKRDEEVSRFKEETDTLKSDINNLNKSMEELSIKSKSNQIDFDEKEKKIKDEIEMLRRINASLNIDFDNLMKDAKELAKAVGNDKEEEQAFLKCLSENYVRTVI